MSQQASWLSWPIGCEVQPSDEALRRNLFRRHGSSWRAVVVGYASDGKALWVQRHGSKSRQAVHVDFLRKVRAHAE